jgi:hypothetical protein
MVQMPEYIVLYLVSVLARRTNSSAKPEAYEACQEILYFLLQVLNFSDLHMLGLQTSWRINIHDSHESVLWCMNLTGVPVLRRQALTEDGSATLPFVCKLLRYVKSTEDAVDDSCTHSLYVLADIALLLVTELSAANGWSIGSFPSSIPLPASYFRVRKLAVETDEGSEQRPLRHGDGSNLPPGFRLSVCGLLPSKSRSRSGLASATSSTHSVARAAPGGPAHEEGQPDPSQAPPLTPRSQTASAVKPHDAKLETVGLAGVTDDGFEPRGKRQRVKAEKHGAA